MSARHGIIPTQTQGNWDNLRCDEQNIYKIIARNYIAQFYLLYEYDETNITLEVVVNNEAYHFACTARIDTDLGWKKLYSNDTDNEETTLPKNTQTIDLTMIKTGDKGICQNTNSNEQQTKPPPLYTTKSLLGDLTRVAKYVKDPQLAKILKDKDKDKQGEHGGIGTPATRSAIIDNLFKRGYLTEKGKSIISTTQGQALYNKLDDLIRYPDMTAIWHHKHKTLQAQDITSTRHYKHKTLQAQDITPLIEQLKQSYTVPKKPDLSNNPPCPKCHRPLKRFASKYKKGEYYWSCTGYSDKNNPCNHTMADKGGTPVEKQPKTPPKDLSEFECKKCGSKLIHRTGTTEKGKNKGKQYSFFGCSGFPKCKQNYDEVGGVPRCE